MRMIKNKRWGRKLLLLFCTCFIGMTSLNIINNEMKAAITDSPKGAKAIDIQVYGGNKVYIVDESHHVYANVGGTYSILKDIEGNPLEKVIQVHTPAGNSSNPLSGVALREDDKIYIWGDNQFGQFGNDTTVDFGIPVLVDPGVSNISKVTLTRTNCYLITDDGSVYVSGDNSHGQFGNSMNESSKTFIDTGIDNIEKIVGGYNGVYAMTKSNELFTWGHKVFDGKQLKTLEDITIPVVVYGSDGTPIKNVIDINSNSTVDRPDDITSISILTQEGGTATAWNLGYLDNGCQIEYVPKEIFSKSNVNKAYDVSYTYLKDVKTAFVADGVLYLPNGPYINGSITSDYDSVKKAFVWHTTTYILSESGAVYINGTQIQVGSLEVIATKADSSTYSSNEKYNDSLSFTVTGNGGSEVTCIISEPDGSSSSVCSDYTDNKLEISSVEGERYYKLIEFSTDEEIRSYIVDLYKKTPTIAQLEASTYVKQGDIIDIQNKTESSTWNTYSAKLTKPDGSIVDYHGEALSEVGSYTLTIIDEYGNQKVYTPTITTNPSPTGIIFMPNPAGELVYDNTITKANQTIGTVSLSYAQGDTPSTIKTITLDQTKGDHTLFTLENDGTLKVASQQLNAKDSYSLYVSGTDQNDMPFTGHITIKIEKAEQANYKIVTGTKKEDVYNFIFNANKTVPISTVNKLGTGTETFEIIENDGVFAQLTGSTPESFTMLAIGKFKVQVTLAEDLNYKGKIITQEIELSDLTPQADFHITSNQSMTYGDTYIPTAEGGSTDGDITWTISNDSVQATLNNGKITVSSVGSFELTATKAGDDTHQAVSDTITVIVNPLAITVTPKDVTLNVGQTFVDQGVTYQPSIISGDTLGTPIITTSQSTAIAGCYTDVIEVTGLQNPNYTITYNKGALNVVSAAIDENDGTPYYRVKSGVMGKQGWYTTDIVLESTGKDGYDLISTKAGNFTQVGNTIKIDSEGEYDISLYFKKSSDGTESTPLSYHVKIDKTAPAIPTMTVDEINHSRIARLLNILSFGSWMNKEAQVTMNSSDAISGLDYYEYIETIKGSDSQLKTSGGTINYGDETELALKARACDKAGNCSAYTNSKEVKVDLKAPEIIGVKDQNEYKQYYIPRFITVSDAGSGIDQANYTKDGGNPIQIDKDTKVKGEGTYTIYALDQAGNEITIVFKIVNLPEIETEIDGSDESKDIIDQVEKELEENKDKLSPDEVKDYEKWIEDAKDKWESMRKKVVETDDKSAKVEGVGDTSFDPSVELIVEPISETDVPVLPRKAIAIYDVYLRKGTTEIQPNGDIKVYLPYSDSVEPILYEIDDDGTITEIKGTLEGNYVTFITRTLKKYAISNVNQEKNDQKEEPKDDINIDSDGDGKPDVNIDFDCDGKADINIDTNNDGIPDINIDTSGDGKPNYNVDLDGDQIPDLNIGPVKWKTDRCTTNGCGKEYCTSTYYKPYLNIDTDGDLRPDVNVDLNKDKIADINIDIDGDYIPDIEIDSNGDGKAEINLDTTGDGRADTNLAIIKEWIPDKDVNEPIKYDTMSNIKVDQILTPDTWQTSKEYQESKGTPTPPKQNVTETNNDVNQGGVNTGDTSKVVFLWVIVILSGILTIVTSRLKNRRNNTYIGKNII